MLGFTKQDFSVNIVIFLWVAVYGGFCLLTGGPYLLGLLLLFMALVNLDAHYKFSYSLYLLARLWNKVNPNKLKKFVYWRYWEEFSNFDLIRKPDFDKPKIPEFVKKNVEISLSLTFKYMKERLESGEKIETPFFEIKENDASSGESP
ncbi:hypothetical protein LCGC14_0579680 [marine sediment metagenome]|uniref:Uncharacterized protein n=1 Tax=marine sediment metagenome TaxID=412755 RepID=A0A0F9U2W1_9ZZZZ